MKLKILVGLNDDCPVEEHVEVCAIEAYPLQVTDPDDEYEYVDIRDENELREWAYRYYNVHKLAEVAVPDGTPLTAVHRTAAIRAEGPTGPPETIGIGPEGTAFPGRPTTSDKHDNEAETRLVRVRYTDDHCEWEARCVEPCIPSEATAEVVCISAVGPLDALHQLRASLAMLGLPAKLRPYVTNIERVALALDD